MSVTHSIQAPSEAPARRWPEPAAVLRLLKPVTWFPPMWAYLCGAVSAGVAFGPNWDRVVLGMLLAGPLVCAMSQAANDWYDRHVDAINEPDRPIPSGRIPGTWGFWIAVAWSVAALGVAALLGPWGVAAAVLAIAMAWAYSAPPLRFKANGWLGCLVCGLSYETLPWLTGAAVMAGAAPSPEILAIALLYGLGAHGIMVLNDFKALEGDRATGIASVPVMLGPERAARVACWTMALPQALVAGLLLAWSMPLAALAVALSLGLQVLAMRRLMEDPAARAPWYNGTGVLLYVLGMMASALALGGVL